MDLTVGIAISMALIAIVLFFPEDVLPFGIYGKLLGAFFTFLFIYNFVLMPTLLTHVLPSNAPIILKWIFWNASWILLMQGLTFYLLFGEDPFLAIRVGLGAFIIIQFVDWLYPPWILSPAGIVNMEMMGASIKIDGMIWHYANKYIPFLMDGQVLGISGAWFMMYFIFPFMLLAFAVFIMAPRQLKEALA